MKADRRGTKRRRQPALFGDRSVLLALGALAALGLGVAFHALLDAGGPDAVPAAPSVLHETLARKRAQTGPHDPALRYGQPSAAMAYELERRLGPVGERPADLDPPALYARALEAARRLPRYSSRLGRMLTPEDVAAQRHIAGPSQLLTTWEELGPGNIGGRTRALLVDPADPRVMIAGTASGGIWKTVDGGRSWQPRGDLLANLSVQTLARHPTDRTTLYAGTGEGLVPESAIDPTGILRGGGIFESRDLGETWRRLPSTVKRDFYWVSDLLISPHDGNRLYAATRTGVWRSPDGGRTWRRVLEPEDPAGCLDLELRPGQPGDSLLASCGLFRQGVVYRNLEAQGDGPWEPVLAEDFQGRTNVAVAPSDPGIVYALATSNRQGRYLNGLLAVFRSDDGGAPGSWHAVTRNTDPVKLDTLLLTNPVFATFAECDFGEENSYFGIGWWANLLAVDPTNPERLWAGGVDLFRSDDGGRNWGLASYWWVDRTPTFAHADHHSLVFHPRYDGVSNRTAFVTTDGGVFRLEDASAATARGPEATCDPHRSRLRFQTLNRGFGATQFYHGAPYPGGGKYLGGTQDNGTLQGSDLLGPEGWRQLLGSDGGYVAVDPDDPEVIYAEIPHGRLRRSTDGGREFEAVAPEAGGPEDFLFIAPFVLDPDHPQRLWLGGRRLWRSNDRGASWTAASTLLGGEDAQQRMASALAVAPRRPRRVLVGTSTGWIHRTDSALQAHGTARWPSTRPRSGFVSSLTFDPENPDIAYATYATFGGDHVWRTVDRGRTWSPLDGDGKGALPDLPVHSIVVDPTHPGRIYLGTDLGVFVSPDGGETWALENTGFANVVTEALSLAESPEGGTLLYAFTHGRGAWRVEIAPPEPPPLRPRRLR